MTTHVISYATVLAAEHPLIDIDWTVFLQFGLFVLTAVVATNLVFKPYLKMRDQRTAGIDGARDEAVRMSSQAEAKMTDYDAKLVAARQKANDERRAMRSQAAEHHRQVTEKAKVSATAAMDSAKQKIDSETQAARAHLLPKATQLAEDITLKLLGRKVA